MANYGTLLVLTGIGVPPYSARGLTQTVEPIQASIHLERDVNGGLVDLSAPQMRKYGSKITCADQDAPAISGIWPGAVVTVECLFELSFLSSQPGRQERTAVSGSLRTDGDFTFYRPQMTMVVMGFNSSTDEYGRVISWELDLEEQ